jgi:hypothetical protein
MTTPLSWDLRSSGVLRSVEWQSFTDVSGERIGPIFKGQEVQEEKMRPIHCPETSVKDYHSTLRYTPEESRSHQRRGGSLKSHFSVLFQCLS